MEGQVFGRGGRQGQPGSCSYILNIQDDYIQALLRSFLLDIKNVKKLRALAKLTNLLQRDSLPTDEILALLNQLRSDQIKQESIRRHHCAQKEFIFF